MKASAGVLYTLTATNNAATITFLKLYNKATAPTAGAQTFGVFSPTGRKDTLVGIEIQVSAVVAVIPHGLLTLGIGS